MGGAIEYEPGVRDDGISLTDYRLLIKEIGPEFADRIVSAEFLLFDYISRARSPALSPRATFSKVQKTRPARAGPVQGEIEMCKLIREDCEAMISKACDGIVPGVTNTDDLGDLFRTGYRKVSTTTPGIWVAFF